MTVHQFPKGGRDHLAKTRKPQKPPREPFFNISEPAPLIAAAILIALHGLFLLAPASVKNTIYEALVLAGNDGTVWLDGRSLGNGATLLTYTLLHDGWTHVLVNSGLLAIFGTGVLRASSYRRKTLLFMIIFIVGAVGGGLFQWGEWVVRSQSGLAIGASASVSAMFACFAWAFGGMRLLIVFGCMVVALDMFTIFFGGIDARNISWAGHLGGYVFGAVIAPFCVRSDKARMSIRR